MRIEAAILCLWILSLFTACVTKHPKSVSAPPFVQQQIHKTVDQDCAGLSPRNPELKTVFSYAEPDGKNAEVKIPTALYIRNPTAGYGDYRSRLLCVQFSDNLTAESDKDLDIPLVIPEILHKKNPLAGKLVNPARVAQLMDLELLPEQAIDQRIAGYDFDTALEFAKISAYFDIPLLSRQLGRRLLALSAENPRGDDHLNVSLSSWFIRDYIHAYERSFGAADNKDPQRGHTGLIHSVIQRSNGQLVSASSDTTIILWNDDGTIAQRFGAVENRNPQQGHTLWVTSVVQLADGRLASASGDFTLILWNIDGTIAQRFGEAGRGYSDRKREHIAEVRSVIQLADGRLASGSDDLTVILWNKDGTIAQRFGKPDHLAGSGALDRPDPNQGHVYPVRSVIQLADGRLASASLDGTVIVWNSDGTISQRFGGLAYDRHPQEGHIGMVYSVIQLADDRLASASEDGTVIVWKQDGTIDKRFGEAGFREARNRDHEKGHTDSVRSVIQLTDGRLASASEDGTVIVWNLDGSIAKRLGMPDPESRNGLGSVIQLADDRLAVADSRNRVLIWDLTW